MGGFPFGPIFATGPQKIVGVVRVDADLLAPTCKSQADGCVYPAPVLNRDPTLIGSRVEWSDVPSCHLFAFVISPFQNAQILAY